MSVRNERLKEAIREEAAELILHDLSDPRLGFCTVTQVELTRDMSYCTIHVSVMGDDGVKSRTIRALNDARGLFQAHIGKRIKTRTTPRVTIELDETIERAFDVMTKIKAARASDSDAGKSTETPEETAAEVELDDDDSIS